MKSQFTLLRPPGEVTAVAELAIPKARQFAEFLEQVGPEAFACLREARLRAIPSAEIIVFSVQVERPQKLAYDIRREEILAAVFPEDDKRAPEILALRADFPNVPHLNLNESEFPRSLCLYEQAYEEVRLSWTPAQFLYRTRFWLAKTASGSLHADDQPLEPLIQPSHSRLILPSDFSASDVYQRPRLLDIYSIAECNGEYTFAAFWREVSRPAKIHSVAAVFSCQAQAHGVIRRQPENLKELHELCLTAGLDLAGALATKIQEWHREKPAPEILRSQLILILLLPKTRREGAVVENVETRAFITGKSVEEVGARLGVIEKHSGVAGYIIGENTIDLGALIEVPVGLLQVHHALSATVAATMNGVEKRGDRILAIGMGALGSQIFNNLVRAGFGQWTVVDPDVLLPHNCSRHCLGEWGLGQNKAEAMASMANAILDGPPIAEAIAADVLKPGNRRETLSKAFTAAELVFDFSASVAVARNLSGMNTPGRHIASYLSPRGNSLVIAAEDRRRAIRLDWLEMLHYRAVLNEPALHDSLHSMDARVRYGNACRDVSAQLAQDDAALWAATASKAIKQIIDQDSPVLRVYLSEPNGSVVLFTPPVTDLLSVRWNDWTVRLDQWVLEKIASLRECKLPSETGGILLGNFDTHHRICSIVDLVPSPPDSSEWPTSYIRGCVGLRQRREQVEKQTLGQIGYVGEWHTHPRGASINPSDDDLKAYAWLVSHMQTETLPAIMLIMGDGGNFGLVAHEP